MDSGCNGNNRKISGDKDTIDGLKCSKVDNSSGDSVSGINSGKVSDSNKDTIGTLKSKKGIAKGTGNVPKKIDSISARNMVLSVNKNIIEGLKNQNKDLTIDTGVVTKKIDGVSDSKYSIDIDSHKNNKDTSVLEKIDSKKEYPKPTGDCNVFNVIPSEGGKTKIGNVGSTAKTNKPYLKCLKTSGSDIGNTKEAKMRMNIMKLFLDRKKNKKGSVPISKVKDSTIVKKTTDDTIQIKCKTKSDDKIKNKGKSVLKQNESEEPKESKKELKLKDDLSEFLVVKKFSKKATEVGNDTDSNTEKIFSLNTNSLLKTSLISLLSKETTFPSNNQKSCIPLKTVTKQTPKIAVDEVEKKIKTVSIGSLYENLVRDTVTDDNDNYCNRLPNESITTPNLLDLNRPDHNPKSTGFIDKVPENNETAVELKNERKRKHNDSDQDIISPIKTKRALKNLCTDYGSVKNINNNNTDLKLNKSKKKVINLDDGSKIRFEYIPNRDLKIIDLTESSESTQDTPTDDDSKKNPDLPVLVL